MEEPFTYSCGRKGNDVETENINFNPAQMSLKCEIEEGEHTIHEEYPETSMLDDLLPSELTQLRFTPATTMFLINEYTKRIDKFLDKKTKRNLLWDEIVNEFLKINFYTTVSQLSEKFRNLKKFHLVVKDNSTITWRYFKAVSQVIKAEEEYLASGNCAYVKKSKNKRARLPGLKFSRKNTKLKKTKTLKQKRGRPPKQKRPSVDSQDVNVFENNKNHNCSNSPYPINIEIPRPDRVEERIRSIDTQNLNSLETYKDNEIKIAPRIVSLSPVKHHEIPPAITNINEELSEFQKRILQIEEEKRDELRKLRLTVEENSKMQRKNNKLLYERCLNGH